MDAEQTPDVQHFLDLAAPVLARDPVATNVIATNAHAYARGTRTGRPVWWTVRDGGQVVAVAMHDEPFPLVLGPLPAGSPPDAVEALADALVEAYTATGRSTTGGVNGTRAEAQAFAGRWSHAQGLDHHLTQAQRMYEVVDVVPARPTSGQARLATPADLDLVVSWMHEFHREADPHAERGDVVGLTRDRLTEELFVLWEVDGEPVALAGLHAPAAGVTRIGPVYTPARHRGRGFASAATEHATRRGFALGAGRCMLYTDLANPTANKIYQALGYRPVGDAVRYQFEPRG